MNRNTPRASATRRRHRLEIGDLEALAQGEMDGFCGLYASINAMRLLLLRRRPLSWRETRQLFAVGIEHLAKRGILAEAATSGFEPRILKRLLQVLAAEAAAITGQQVALSQPLRHIRRPTRDQLFEITEQAIDTGKVVLIELAGTYQHFTLVRGITDRSLLLFDSGVLFRLSCDHCGLTAKGKRRSHVINPNSFTVLELKPSTGVIIEI